MAGRVWASVRYAPWWDGDTGHGKQAGRQAKHTAAHIPGTKEAESWLARVAIAQGERNVCKLRGQGCAPDGGNATAVALRQGKERGR